MTSTQVAIEYLTMFSWTGAVFGVTLSLCLVSLIPLGLMLAATLVIAGFVCLQSVLLTHSPLDGLWPSGIGFPAGVLHLGIATSMWLVLRRRVPGKLREA